MMTLMKPAKIVSDRFELAVSEFDDEGVDHAGRHNSKR